MKDRSIKLACPACERKLKMGDSQIGKAIVCPRCNTKFRINNSMIAEIIGRGSGTAAETVLRDKEIVRAAGMGNGAFEDIDALFSSNDIASHAKQIETRRQRKREGENVQQEDPEIRWKKQKRTVTKSDERLARNGIGLLIVAATLSLLPFFAATVPELKWLLPYLPLTAIAIAFLATFLVTLSNRRSGFASIILSLFPLVFIGIASTGGHYYLRYLAPEKAKADVDEKASETEPQPNHDDGRITVDRESINENPASKFVPPRHAQTSGDFKPSLMRGKSSPKEPDDSLLEDRSGVNAKAKPILNESDRELAQQLDQPINLLENKRDAMIERIEEEGTRALVSRGKIRQKKLHTQFTFSKVVGETTVYGTLFVVDGLVQGFDVLLAEENPTIAVVTPFSGKPPFLDSQFDKESNLPLTGINIHRSNQGIVGLQGCYSDGVDNNLVSSWTGQAPDDDDGFVTIRSAPGQLAGFVLYRDKMHTVGLGLVFRRD